MKSKKEEDKKPSDLERGSRFSAYNGE